MFGKEKAPKRFKIKDEQSIGLMGIYILVDTVTGVNYMCVCGTGNSGITPLLDSNGDVVIDR